MAEVLYAILGLVGVVKAADYFVDQSVALAKKLKVGGFLIGFTIVAFGTSLPELVVSIYSTYSGHSSIAISNVVGSNIANICLVIGLLSFYRPYKLTKKDVFKNIPLNLFGLITFILVVILGKGTVGILGGIILLGLFLFSLSFVKNEEQAGRIKANIKFNSLIFLLSLICLIFLGKFTVDSVLLIAENYGIKESSIGYFIIALGTSIPEFITSFIAVKKGNADLGIGNILGSNLFNLLFILGLSAMIRTLDLSMFIKEITFLVIIMCSLVILALLGKKYFFSKLEGLILLLFYLFFIGMQIN